jgi:hypothetical protein
MKWSQELKHAEGQTGTDFQNNRLSRETIGPIFKLWALKETCVYDYHTA